MSYVFPASQELAFLLASQDAHMWSSENKNWYVNVWPTRTGLLKERYSYGLEGGLQLERWVGSLSEQRPRGSVWLWSGWGAGGQGKGKEEVRESRAGWIGLCLWARPGNWAVSNGWGSTESLWEEVDGDGVVGMLFWWLVLEWTEEWKQTGWLGLPRLRVEGHG